MKNAAFAGFVIAAMIAGYVIYRSASGGNGIKAICNDGTISMSKKNQGTCSYHNGVKRWTKDE